VPIEISATMASHFVEAGEELIEELRNTSENKNTLKKNCGLLD